MENVLMNAVFTQTRSIWFTIRAGEIIFSLCALDIEPQSIHPADVDIDCSRCPLETSLSRGAKLLKELDLASVFSSKRN